MNRVNDYYGMNLSSGWVLQGQRDIRLGFGQFIYDTFGSTNGAFSHISVVPSTGLYVQVGPSSANTLGSIYQFRVDDSAPYGSGATQLSSDPTQTFVQGLLSTPTIALGPFTAPTATGQSIQDLVECQVQTVDATPQTELFETAPNTTVSQTANRDRNDIVVCQIKTGTATTAIPVVPAADAGWVAIANVFVANGQTSLSTLNVSMATSTQFYGFVPQTASGTLPIAELPHGDYLDLANAQTVGGTKTFTSQVGAPGALLGGVAQIMPTSAQSASGVSCNLLGLAYSGTSWNACFDFQGDLGILKNFFAQTVTASTIAGTNYTGNLVNSLNGVVGATTIASPDNSLTVTKSGQTISIVSAGHIIGGQSTTDQYGNTTIQVPYQIVSATANIGVNTNSTQQEQVYIDQQDSNFLAGSVVFHAIVFGSTASYAPTGTAIFYNVTTNGTAHS